MASPATRCPRCSGQGKIVNNEGPQPWPEMTCPSCEGTGLNISTRIAMDMAEQLAFKLNNPMWFADGVRESFDQYTKLVGEENLTDEVKQARTL